MSLLKLQYTYNHILIGCIYSTKRPNTYLQMYYSQNKTCISKLKLPYFHQYYFSRLIMKKTLSPYFGNKRKPRNHLNCVCKLNVVVQLILGIYKPKMQEKTKSMFTMFIVYINYYIYHRIYLIVQDMSHNKTR